jgi:hypothetical protein
MWVYHSPIGSIYIKKTVDGYRLLYDSECYGVYDSGVAAADDVFTFHTNCEAWDSLRGSVDPPTDFSEWEHC